MSLVTKFNFKSKGDSRGELVILEALKDIPFDVKRIYYLKNLFLHNISLFLSNGKFRGFCKKIPSARV